MPSIDLATAQVFIDDNAIDVSFEFAHTELKDLVKSKYRANFIKDRKCWRINRFYQKAPPEDIVADITKALAENAPPHWSAIYEKFKNFACATKKYEIKFGPGGLRLIFPAGHAAHYALKKVMGYEAKLSTWYLPAKLIKMNDVLPLIQRAEREDRVWIEEALEPYENRTVKGRLYMTPQEATESNVVVGSVCFADFPFVGKIEPYVADMQLHYWPFKVLEREDKPIPLDDNPDFVEVSVRLMYMPPEPGCKAVRKYMSLALEDRPWPLDVTKAQDKWKSKTLD